MTGADGSEDGATRAGTWVIVPAFEEAEAIGPVVSNLRGAGWQVLVVDDGSSDATASAGMRAGAVVLRHAINLGQGAALRTGFAFAMAQPEVRWVVTFDADGQHDLGAIPALLAPLVTGAAEVTLGSRFLDPDSAHQIPRSRQRLLRVATAISRATTRLPLTDTHNGLRGFTIGALRQLRLEQDRMAHASEILAEIARCGLSVREIPVRVHYSAYSIAKGQRPLDAINILWDLFLNRSR